MTRNRGIRPKSKLMALVAALFTTGLFLQPSAMAAAQAPTDQTEQQVLAFLVSHPSATRSAKYQVSFSGGPFCSTSSRRARHTSRQTRVCDLTCVRLLGRQLTRIFDRHPRPLWTGTGARTARLLLGTAYMRMRTGEEGCCSSTTARPRATTTT